MVLKAPQKKKFFAQNLEKKPPSKWTEHTRKELCTPKWTPNNFLKFFYFNPEVAHTYRLYGVKIRKIRSIEYLTLGHL